ncbi:Uncharacterised protein [Stenotrophomonas maltophilia]|nr:Uncharacterised protein [Stenotrophomonas maltophilia]
MDAGMPLPKGRVFRRVSDPIETSDRYPQCVGHMHAPGVQADDERSTGEKCRPGQRRIHATQITHPWRPLRRFQAPRLSGSDQGDLIAPGLQSAGDHGPVNQGPALAGMISPYTEQCPAFGLQQRARLLQTMHRNRHPDWLCIISECPQPGDRAVLARLETRPQCPALTAVDVSEFAWQAAQCSEMARFQAGDHHRTTAQSGTDSREGQQQISQMRTAHPELCGHNSNGPLDTNRHDYQASN